MMAELGWVPLWPCHSRWSDDGRRTVPTTTSARGECVFGFDPYLGELRLQQAYYPRTPYMSG